jgi:histidyl-tRNA synthetase
VLGDSEAEKQVIGLKSLRVEAPQIELAWSDVAGELRTRLADRR